jgi:hypothetical protein
MVGHHRDLENCFDIPLAQLAPRHFPEFLSIIATNPDSPENACEDLDRTPKIGPRELIQETSWSLAM